MSDQDLFNNDDTKDPSSETQNENKDEQSSDYNQMLSLIVNQDGKQKYNSVEEVIKGTIHAQAHISNLEKELSTMKETQKESSKIEDVISAIKQENSSDNGDKKGESISPTAIQDIVNKTIRDINSESVREENVTTVISKFKDLYGDKASETLYGKANDLGLSKEDINSLIEKNPNAVFRMLGVDKTNKDNTNLDTSNFNSESFKEKKKEEINSSMGFISSKQLEANWLESKKRTLARLENS